MNVLSRRAAACTPVSALLSITTCKQKRGGKLFLWCFPVESTRFSSDREAHEHAMSMSIAQVVQELERLLGATMVAVIGGVAETRAVSQWKSGREPQRPHPLRFALQVALMIATGVDQEVARAWFQGSNPDLDDATPLSLLRDRPLAEVQTSLLRAARSFAHSLYGSATFPDSSRVFCALGRPFYC